MKRRNFIKLAGAGAVGAALPNNLLGNAFRLDELESGGQFDVIIIGTGYGASVSALRLAENGVRCLMLEMGMDWDKEKAKFSNHVVPTKASTWLRNTTNFPFFNYAVFEKYTGALDSYDYGFSYGNKFGLYMGRGVGGGSLVNGGMYIEPLREEFEKAFPSLNADLFYDNYFPIAKENLTGTEVPDDILQNDYFTFAEVGKKEFTKAGYSYFKMLSNYDKEYLRKELNGEVEGSATKQELFYGNNAGKKDLRKTYLAKALETGNVSILALHKVEQIVELENGNFELLVTEINTKGRVIAKKEYTTSKLFLGCGSIGTTELLLKSQYKGTLTKLDHTVGKKWGNNGNLNTVRALMSEPVGERQATVPTYGVDAWNDTDEAFIAELGALPAWVDPRSVAYIFVNRVKELGTMKYNPIKDRVEIDFPNVNWDLIEGNAKRFLGKLSEVNGGGTSSLGELINRYAWHLLGGCVYNYATDEYGRLNNYDNLYITDSSLIPGQIGVNPFATITALAEYLIENVIREDFNEPIDTPSTVLNLIATPNPFKDSIHLNFQSNQATTATAQIINWAGRIVANVEFEATKGDNNYHWSGLSFLWKQAYTLRLDVGEQYETTRVIRASWW